VSVTTVVIAAAAVLAVIVFLVARGRKQQQSESDGAMGALGMEPVSALDPALTAAIIALHRPPAPGTTIKQTWSLTRILRYPEPGATCYSVTVHLEQEREVQRTGTAHRFETRDARVVAVVAPATLQAPRMHLMPRAIIDPAAGALAKMAAEAANALTDEAAEQSGDRVEFADDAAFERRYLVLSPAYGPARAFLDPTRRQELAALDGVQISLEGSLMLVSSPADAIRHRDRSLEESLRAELENARRVLQIFGQPARSA